MAKVEVAKTLVKSPPELWTELEGNRLSDAVGEVSVRPTEHERALVWEASGAHGTAQLEPTGWGTKVTLTAEVEETVAERGFWGRVRGGPPRPTAGEIEQRLSTLLDTLGGIRQ